LSVTNGQIMKIAVLIPDRNDRPEFLKNCLRMIEGQTMKPEIVELVNDEPLTFNPDGYMLPSEKPKRRDITWRYRIGYDRLRDKGVDCILLMENDDWYAPNYIETMVNEWVKQGRPKMLGTDYTIYYHIGLFMYLTMNHKRRSSAMSTLIKPDLKFDWCVDHEPFTDIHLWKTVGGKIFSPITHICIGIKHGVGLCGGKLHNDEKTERYWRMGIKDTDKTFIRSIMDEQSFNFYSTYLCNTK
jgi:glycosyltransferase involved in cell wall biosynthesis